MNGGMNKAQANGRFGDAGETKNGEIGVRRILIVRYGEVALKGMNKPYFERVLTERIARALRDPAHENSRNALKIERSDGLIVIGGRGETLPFREDVLIKRISKVFGVASVSPAVALRDRDMASVSAAVTEFMRERISRRFDAEGRPLRETRGPLTFKVFGKRSDKTYPIESPDISRALGADILRALGPSVKVDVRDPDVRLFVHLRKNEVFIYDEKIGGFGGLPLGTNGKGMVLLSGGIDSPVATWMMAKRGMRVEAVHYHSYPYTSGRAREKVEELAEILSEYCGDFKLRVVNLLPAQEEIVAHCPESLTTLLTRRFMMKIAERLAVRERCNMLVTGESLGQVASQTAEALFVTDAAVSLPVMRPLIAMDKTDIIEKAKEIGTFEKSIEPYEDCCTVFLPKHPATRPKADGVLAAERSIPDAEGLIERLSASAEVVHIRRSPSNG
ncbi:MAG: tRNA 4-thiouridine(8) synthase ThiI [Clostridiales Family XIII bacterium]|jgi:thiamine biosynthesis protein ThiI|nr:tRNA 4-thiouridine(8) synthase ThiI [Clostridiales Family XIII bacterium]